MLAHEGIIGHVGVERTNDVVAVLVGIGNDKIALVPARFGVPHKVQPVPRPTLTELRRCQQLIHHPLARLRRAVVQKRRKLLGRWRQPNERKINPAQPDSRRGGWGWLKSFLFEARKYETIHGTERPGGVRDGWDALAARRLPNPRQPLFSLREIEAVRLHSRRRPLVLWPDGPVADPTLEIGDHRIRQPRLFRWHRELLVAM